MWCVRVGIYADCIEKDPLELISYNGAGHYIMLE